MLLELVDVLEFEDVMRGFHQFLVNARAEVGGLARRKSTQKVATLLCDARSKKAVHGLIDWEGVDRQC